MVGRESGKGRPARGARRVRSLVVGGWILVAGGLLVHEEGAFWRNAETRLEAAKAALDRGAWQEALAIIQEVGSLNTDEAYVAILEGRARLGLGEASEAASRYRAAADLAPEDAEPWLGLAEALLAMSDTSGASLALDEALERCPGPECVDRYARLKDAAGDEKAALRAYEVLASPAHVDDRLRLYLSAGHWDDAVALVREHADDPGAPDRRSDLAWALSSGGRADEAESVYRSLAEDEALSTSDAVRLAWLLNQQGRHAEALAVLEPRQGTSPEVDALRVRTTLWAGRPREARDRLDDLRARRPDLTDLGALVAEVDGAVRDLEEAEAAAARADTPPSDPEAALDFWRQRLADRPSDPKARAEAVALLEQLGRFEEAHAVLLGRAMDEPTNPQVLEHLARLSAWAGKHERAVEWYRDYEELAEPLSHDVLVGFVSALLASGEPEEALERLAEAGLDGEGDPELLLLGARAAHEAGDPAAAADHLERLAQARGLTEDELRWLADEYRSAGRREDAVAVWTSLLTRRPEDRDVRVALASALTEAGDWAEVVRVLGPADSLGAPEAPWLARALTESGRPLEGASIYAEYLDGHPEDLDARLALARTLASAGREQAALPHYLQYAEHGSDSASAEIAQAYLAVQDWEAAEEWARRGLDAVGSSTERLVLAEALVYQGRSSEAGEILAPLLTDERLGTVDRLAVARAARLTGEPLRAQRILEELSGEGAEPRGEIALLMAEVAWERGDMHLMGQALDQAREAGLGEHRLSDLETRFDRETRAKATVIAAAGEGDPVEEGALRADATAWPMERRFRLDAFAEPRVLRAVGAESRLLSTGASVGRFFVASDLRLGAGAGLLLQEGEGAALTGHVALDRSFVGGSELGMRFARRAIWDSDGSPAPSRPLALRSADPDVTSLMQTDLRMRGQRSLGAGRHLHMEVGRSWLADENAKSYAYAHLQLPLSSVPGRWIALQPNLYGEDFRQQRAGYASPSAYLSAGLRAQGIWQAEAHELALEVNPHLFRFSGESGLGVEAGLSSKHRFGPTQLLLNASYFKQEDIFDLWRVSMGLELPLGSR